VTAFIATGGALEGQRFELEGDHTIGREGADITLDDDQVSRSHARVSVADGTVTIEDLGSTNGTFVNGARIEEATTLAPGDTVRIGATTFALEAEAEAESELEPEPAPAMPEPAVTVAREAAPAPPAPEPAPPAAPAPAFATGTVGAPREPFGAYLAPESAKHGGGIQSRQRLPILVTYAIVLGVAVALALYFAYV
jgi:predicted component of type VI protein secretion system